MTGPAGRLQGWQLGLVALLLPSLHGAAGPRRTLPQDAYVWQRAWTPGLAVALAHTGPLVRGLRVLVAEWSPDGHLAHAGVDWPLLAALGRPVVAVLRVDGRRRLPAPEVVRAALPEPHGAVLEGMELDYDCPTAQLEAYSAFLHALRPLLPPGLRLSITALPDWLRDGAFPALSAEADQLVLQVHATDDPRRGLFRPAAAERRAWLMARRSARPFLVSLPAYGVRVTRGENGRVLATEAERPALAGADAGAELAAAPAEVMAAVEALEADPPTGLVGLVWFRVPTDADARAWSRGTWEAALRRAMPAPHLLLRPAAGPDGLTVLSLVNDGATDAPLPPRIPLAGECDAADGAGPYRLERDPSVLVLRGAGDALLRAGEAATVGWTRCPGSEHPLP